MPSYIVRNENYRDEILKYAYPFDENSRLESDDVYFGTDVVIDAVFFFKEPVELPVHISEVDGTYGEGQIRLLLSDNNGVLVAQTVMESDTETSIVTSMRGVRSGLLVYDLNGVERFIGRTSGQVVALLPDVAVFSLDVSHVAPPFGLRFVAADEDSIYDEVDVVAGHGLQFSIQSGVLSLNVVGERVEDVSESTRTPIVSINGVRNKSIWFAAHPQLNLRFDNTGAGIRFVHCQDDTR